MGLKPDHWIRKMATEHRMIEPFQPEQVRNGQISYGVSSYGYDIRVADEYMIFTNVYSAVVDPKHFDPRSMVEYKGEFVGVREMRKFFASYFKGFPNASRLRTALVQVETVEEAIEVAF